MTAFVPTQLGVMLPSDINDLAAAGIADGEFAKRVAGAWAGSFAVKDAIRDRMGCELLQILQFNVASGVNVFTPSIPVGYKWLFSATSAVANPTTSAMTFSSYLRRVGIDYQMANALSIPSRGTQAITFGGLPAVMQSGDSLVFTPSGSGLTLCVTGYLVPDTSNMKIFAVPLGVGNTTIYTVPTGKVAKMTNDSSVVNFSQIGIANSTGSTRVIGMYINNNKAYEAQVINAQISALNLPQFRLVGGDSFIINSDGSGNQMCFALFWET